MMPLEAASAVAEMKKLPTAQSEDEESQALWTWDETTAKFHR
jgi:hypothetical protein